MNHHHQKPGHSTPLINKKIQRLVITLILSISLNCSFITLTLINYFHHQEEPLISLTPKNKLLDLWSRFSYMDIDQLTSIIKQPIEPSISLGINKKELALTALVSLHHIDLERALNYQINLSLDYQTPPLLISKLNEPLKFTEPYRPLIKEIKSLTSENYIQIIDFIKKDLFPFSPYAIHLSLSQKSIPTSYRYLHDPSIELLQNLCRSLPCFNHFEWAYWHTFSSSSGSSSYDLLEIWTQLPWSAIKTFNDRYSESGGDSANTSLIIYHLINELLDASPSKVSKEIYTHYHPDLLENLDDRSALALIENIDLSQEDQKNFLNALLPYLEHRVILKALAEKKIAEKSH